MTGKVLRGVVRGSTIELQGDSGISEGEQVEVVVRRVVPKQKRPGDGFVRTEGALANDSEWDAIMEEIHQARKQDRRSQWEGE